MGLRSSIFRRVFSGGSFTNKYRPRPDLGITKTILSFGQNASVFHEDIWEELYIEIIEAQQDKAGNSGQETLLSDEYFGGSAKNFCKQYGEDYNPEQFVSYVQNDLGDDYYNAISIIIDECAEELIEAWDRATSNDGIGEKLFGGAIGSQRRVYGSFSNALAIYQSSAISRGYDFSGTAAANAKNRALNKQTTINFRKNNPDGTARPSYVSASYRNAARKNGKNL